MKDDRRSGVFRRRYRLRSGLQAADMARGTRRGWSTGWTALLLLSAASKRLVV